MPRYVAFLRAINVGGHTVKMDRLRALFEELGFDNVKTFIASGNVLFDSAARNRSTLETKIERHLEKALGYQVATFVRTLAELKPVVDFRPSGVPAAEFESRSLYVGLLKSLPAPDVQQRVAAIGNDIDRFYFNGPQLYWSCATSIGQTTIPGGRLEKALEMPMTVRSVTTMRKLASA
jgi:uncharacterized protein (DUF1697 family)